MVATGHCGHWRVHVLDCGGVDMKRAHLAGIKRVLDELGTNLGGELVVSYARPERLGTGEMVKLRVACDRQGEVRSRWPNVPSMGVPAEWAVLGAAPFPDDRGLAWTGGIGRFMRAEIAQAGGDGSEVAYLNLTPSVVGEAPNMTTLLQWRHWAMTAVRAANCSYILLAGAQAVRAWRGDVNLGRVGLDRRGAGVGLWRVQGRQMIVGCLPSPLAVRRDPMMLDRWRVGLARWVAIVRQGEAVDAVGSDCAMKGCIETAWSYDADGVPWCRAHWSPDGPDKAHKMWVYKHEGQEVML